MRRFKKLNSMKTKMVLLLGSIILLVSVGMGLMSYYISSHALVINVKQMLPVMAEQSSLLIEGSISESFKLLDMIQYSNKDSSLTEEQKFSKLKIQEVKGKYLLLGIADLNGKLITADEKEINISDMDVYQKALKGEQAVSEPIKDTFGISGLSDSSMVIVYANPTKVGGKVESVLVAVKSGNEFSTIVNDISFGKTGRAFMINGLGEMIAHNNLSLVYDKTNYILKAENDKSFRQMADMLDLMIKGNNGTGEYTYNGVKNYAGYAPIGSTGWSIAIVGESSDILSGLNKLESTSKILAVLFLLGGVIAVFFITDSITKGLILNVKTIGIMANGDLTERVLDKYRKKKDEVGILANSLSKMQSFIRDMIINIKNSSSDIDSQSENLFTISKTVTDATDNVTVAIQDVAKGASEQAEELCNILNRLNHFSTELGNVAQLINNIDKNTSGISIMAEDSNTNMRFLVESWHVINDSFKDFMFKIMDLSKNINKVNEIANFINDIADQTNLLSLNATIEAARAGESGRGFTVVANNIRNLADQTKTLSININTIINGVIIEAENMVGNTKSMDKELSNQIMVLNTTLDSFETMIKAFHGMSPEIESVNASTYELDYEKNLIIEKIEGIAAIAEQVSASSEEIAASAEEMNTSMDDITSAAQTLTVMTKEMQMQVNQFKISE